MVVSGIQTHKYLLWVRHLLKVTQEEDRGDNRKRPDSHCVLDPRCGAREVFEAVTGRWGPLVVMALKGGKRRHGELRRELEGVSQKMLIQTLRNLERNGLVEREVYPVVPPKVEYSLTPLGCRCNPCSGPFASGPSDTSRRWRRRAWPRAMRRSGAGRERRRTGGNLASQGCRLNRHE